MSAGTLSYPCRMEIGTFKHHIARGLIGSASLAAKNTGDAHRGFGIANAQVVLAKRMLFPVESDKFGSFRLGAHHNLVPNHHVCIKAVHRLSISHHHIVGDVYNIVDRAQPDDPQLVLQPLRTFLHLTIGNAHTGITLAGLLVFDFHIYGQAVVVHLERLAVRTMQRRGVAILHQPGIKVASHTVVRKRIRAIGCDVYFYHPVALQMIIFRCRLSHRCVFGQNDDSGMVGANAYLVFSTNHSERFHTTQFAFFDGKLLFAIIEHASQVCDNHLLAGSHIGSPAHNLLRFALAQIHRRDMKVIAIGVRLTRKHLAYEKPFQSAFDRLHFFESINFQSARGQCVCRFLRGKVEVDVFFKPFVRNVHSIAFLYSQNDAKVRIFRH